MSWLQVHIVTIQEKAFLAELLLEGLQAVSVTMTDAEDHPVLETDPGEVRLWPHTCVTGLFTSDTDPDWLIKAVRNGMEKDVVKSIQLETLKDQVWERVWMDHFHPMQFGKKLWIRPTGGVIEQPDAVIVELDPGLAFGTGTHPTTALCLEWLDAHPPTGQKVIDWGCGSGILAIAALKLGATNVIGIDHDSQALLSSRDNAITNGVSERLQVLGSDENPVEPANLMMANILSEVLIKLEGQLAENTVSGGAIILSGILEEQAESVIQAFQPHFHLSTPITKDGWVLIEGSRL